jgi:nicotinamide-nucleotide adenylyltransferase
VSGRVLMVGRFQPIHNGHILVVREMVKRYASVILGIGSAQYSHTAENPFTAGERVEMATEALRGEGVADFYVVPIEDINEHGRWVAHVESLVPRFSAVATNNPLNQRLFQEEGYEVCTTPLYSRSRYSGTVIRRRMLQGRAWKTLVPEPVARIIGEVDGVSRIRQLAGKDE